MTDPNNCKTLRAIAEATQPEAADLMGVSLSTWKRWEADDAVLKPDKVEAFKLAVTRRDLNPKVGVEGALAKLKELGRTLPRPDWYTDDDPYGQRSGDQFRGSYRGQPAEASPRDDDFVMKSDGVTDAEVVELQREIDAAKARGEDLETTF